VSFLQVLQDFFEDLRREGVPVTPSQAADCCRALLLVDWTMEDYFYTSLYTTLVKEYGHQAAFKSVYRRHFQPGSRGEMSRQERPGAPDRVRRPIENTSTYAGDALPVHGMQSLRGGLSQGRRNPLDQPFSLASLDDVRKMETLFPVIAKRLAARMIKKNRKNDRCAIDYRSTMRQSMSTGGVLLNVVTFQKKKEKPVIVALCDISGSVMTFSCFALALLASMQRFFRQLRTFAFIEEVDEITHLLRAGDPLTLRTSVLKNARRVMGARGYTNYGATFKGFIERYGNILSHKTSVLIFGDARNNWFNDETWALEEIKKKAKKVYWFNPEPEISWSSGDSRMLEYIRHCHKYFSCPSLSELERAIGQL